MTVHGNRPRIAVRKTIPDVVVALVLVLSVNGLVFAFADARGSQGGRWFGRIPGWSIGLIWTGLFALLGIAHGRLRQLREPGDAARRLVATLIVVCAAYPLYTFGLRSQLVGLVGNLLTLALAVNGLYRSLAVDRWSTSCVAAVVVWLAFATVALVDEAGWNLVATAPTR